MLVVDLDVDERFDVEVETGFTLEEVLVPLQAVTPIASITPKIVKNFAFFINLLCNESRCVSFL